MAFGSIETNQTSIRRPKKCVLSDDTHNSVYARGIGILLLIAATVCYFLTLLIESRGCVGIIVAVLIVVAGGQDLGVSEDNNYSDTMILPQQQEKDALEVVSEGIKCKAISHIGYNDRYSGTEELFGKPIDIELADVILLLIILSSIIFGMLNKKYKSGVKCISIMVSNWMIFKDARRVIISNGHGKKQTNYTYQNKLISEQYTAAILITQQYTAVTSETNFEQREDYGDELNEEEARKEEDAKEKIETEQRRITLGEERKHEIEREEQRWQREEAITEDDEEAIINFGEFQKEFEAVLEDARLVTKRDRESIERKNDIELIDGRIVQVTQQEEQDDRIEEDKQEKRGRVLDDSDMDILCVIEHKLLYQLELNTSYSLIIIFYAIAVGIVDIVSIAVMRGSGGAVYEDNIKLNQDELLKRLSLPPHGLKLFELSIYLVLSIVMDELITIILAAIGCDDCLTSRILEAGKATIEEEEGKKKQDLGKGQITTELNYKWNENVSGAITQLSLCPYKDAYKQVWSLYTIIIYALLARELSSKLLRPTLSLRLDREDPYEFGEEGKIRQKRSDSFSSNYLFCYVFDASIIILNIVLITMILLLLLICYARYLERAKFKQRKQQKQLTFAGIRSYIYLVGILFVAGIRSYIYLPTILSQISIRVAVEEDNRRRLGMNLSSQLSRKERSNKIENQLLSSTVQRHILCYVLNIIEFIIYLILMKITRVLKERRGVIIEDVEEEEKEQERCRVLKDLYINSIIIYINSIINYIIKYTVVLLAQGLYIEIFDNYINQVTTNIIMSQEIYLILLLLLLYEIELPGRRRKRKGIRGKEGKDVELLVISTLQRVGSRPHVQKSQPSNILYRLISDLKLIDKNLFDELLLILLSIINIGFEYEIIRVVLWLLLSIITIDYAMHWAMLYVEKLVDYLVIAYDIAQGLYIASYYKYFGNYVTYYMVQNFDRLQYMNSYELRAKLIIVQCQIELILIDLCKRILLDYALINCDVVQGSYILYHKFFDNYMNYCMITSFGIRSIGYNEKIQMGYNFYVVLITIIFMLIMVNLYEIHENMIIGYIKKLSTSTSQRHITRPHVLNILCNYGIEYILNHIGNIMLYNDRIRCINNYWIMCDIFR